MARSRYRTYFLHASFGGFELPNHSMWVQRHGFKWDDTVPPDSGMPRSDYETVREQLLDPLDVEYHFREA
ncbi:MAG: hypothetical protein M3316_07180 [Actinomycetota bacterium]|nr:hypothetical protein [Actinomycetota bacterium]